MSIYDNDTSKIYPDLDPASLREPQAYRWKELSEIEVYLLDKIEVRECLAKKMKRFNKITSIVEMGLIT